MGFRKGHKHSENWKRKMIGSTPWNKGLNGVMPIPWNKGKKTGKNIKLSLWLKKHPINYWLGKKRSKETIEKIRKNRKGKNRGVSNKAWKGGVSPLNRLIRHTFEYRQWRSDVFTRDEFTCQWCNKTGCYLEAHHIKPLGKILSDNKIKTTEQAFACEELWNLNNGTTLCLECHAPTKGRRKQNSKNL